MPIYEWRYKPTGETFSVVRPVDLHGEPPDGHESGIYATDANDWERVYSFGVGRVEGAGGSKARPSV